MKAIWMALALVALCGTAEAQSACDWGNLRSEASEESRELVVTNAVGDRSARLYWIDFNGTPVFYAEIPPNGRHVQQTLRRHVWIAENSYGYCDVIFTVENNVEIVIR
jgi:hypothetical protein